MRPISTTLIGLLAIAGMTLPVAAQSQRYPTERELQLLVQQVRQKLPDLERESGYQNPEFAANRQKLQVYTAAWAKVDPAIAPFLGSWMAIEETFHVYPTRRKGQVCIIDNHLDEYEFMLGTVSNGKIRTAPAKLVLFREGRFLAIASVYDGKPNTYEYANPRPLPDPERTSYLKPQTAIVRQFKQAGCVVGLPRQ